MILPRNWLIYALPVFGLIFSALTGSQCAFAQVKAEKVSTEKSSGLGNFGNSKEPVKVDAASLQVLDKEQKAIYTGDVVAVQGASTLRCSVMTIFYTQQKDGKAKGEGKAEVKAETAAKPAAGSGGSSIRKIECKGPVSVVSTTQTATGDFGIFDAEHDLVTLTGNVVLADCDNVQQGDKLVYNTKTGIANVTNNGGRRVQGVFTPSSDDKDKAGTAVAAKKKTGCDTKK